MSKIAIVTDSTADIPENLLEDYSIHLINNIIVIDGKGIEDGQGISRADFYRQLPTMLSQPTTATASSGVYQQLYEKIFQQGVSYILSIHPSTLLSGIYNAASVAAQAFGERVRVIDSQQISLGLGFQVLAAAEAALSQPLESVLSVLEEVRRRVRLVAMLDTLEFVRRSGRVSWARARLGTLLNIKPFVEVKDGTIISLGEARTRRKGIERLLALLSNLGALERLAILHTNAEEDAYSLLDALHVQLTSPPLVVNVTTVIGTHTGPNGLGFAAVMRW